jgi:hypothetical protein
MQSVHLGQLSMAFLKSVVEKHIRPPGAGASILGLKTQTILCISLVGIIGKECACLSNGCIKHLHSSDILCSCPIHRVFVGLYSNSPRAGRSWNQLLVGG